MKALAALLTFFAISHAATLIPVDSSVVNVKTEHSGQDYAYSIQENHGYAINPTGPVHPGIPVVKTVAGVPVGSGVPVPGQVHVETHHQEHEIRPQSVAKAVSEPIVPEHGVPVGSFPTTYVGYVPVSYQYGIPYGYAHPYNFLSYKIA